MASAAVAAMVRFGRPELAEKAMPTTEALPAE
jgi:hypothetical protein